MVVDKFKKKLRDTYGNATPFLYHVSYKSLRTILRMAQLHGFQLCPYPSHLYKKGYVANYYLIWDVLQKYK